MQNKDNQNTYFIYIRSTGEKVPDTKVSSTIKSIPFNLSFKDLIKLILSIIK